MKTICEKGTLALLGTWIGNKYGDLLPTIIFLSILMIIDYISGMLASKKEAIEHPNSKKYGWSSKKSIIGIYKKVGYILTILVAFSTDYLIDKYLMELVNITLRRSRLSGVARATNPD